MTATGSVKRVGRAGDRALFHAALNATACIVYSDISHLGGMVFVSAGVLPVPIRPATVVAPWRRFCLESVSRPG